MRAVRICAVAVALGCATISVAAAGLAGSKPLLGVTGDTHRFKALTGQTSTVRQTFIGWGQGETWGSPFASLLAGLGAIPLIHLGTSGKPPAAGAVITPAQIAAGKGDDYLLALNQAISDWGKLIYLRPMAEMNNPETLYGSTPPKAYRAAFERIYLILHGGSGTSLSATLRRLGQPPLKGDTDLPVNPSTKLRVIWNPIAGNSGWQSFYPGDRYLDLVGNDMYAEGQGFSDRENEALYAFAHSHHKRYALPEFSLTVDDPSFVRYICSFIRAHSDVELAAYYNSKAGSRWDLWNKPASRAAYRSCISPLG